MQSIMRRLCRIGLLGLGWLAGGGCLLSLTGCYGMPPPGPPPPADLDTRVLSFSYAPPSPVAAGTSLRFTLTAAENTDRWVGYELYVAEDDPRVPEAVRWQLFSTLNDSGLGPDQRAGDGVYCAELTLPAGLPALSGYTVAVHANWHYGYGEPLPTVYASPLTVQPAGGGAT